MEESLQLVRDTGIQRSWMLVAVLSNTAGSILDVLNLLGDVERPQ